jgi:hypothetical protein
MSLRERVCGFYRVAYVVAPGHFFLVRLLGLGSLLWATFLSRATTDTYRDCCCDCECDCGMEFLEHRVNAVDLLVCGSEASSKEASSIDVNQISDR